LEKEKGEGDNFRRALSWVLALGRAERREREEKSVLFFARRKRGERGGPYCRRKKEKFEESIFISDYDNRRGAHTSHSLLKGKKKERKTAP